MPDLNNILEIILITYNRKEHLQNTLQQLFAPASPIKHLPFTILDNASTDGTSDLLQEYAAKYPNIKYIHHAKNIGGNANIARAFEIATKEYVWVLCDDDEYDFTHFDKLEEALAKKPGAVVVATYLKPKKTFARLFKQLSFVPAAVYRTDIINDTVLINANFNISNMFPHLAVSAAVINNKEDIIILDNPLVTMVPHCGPESYIRGAEKGFPHPMMKAMFWEIGYLNSAQMIEDKKLRKEILQDLSPENKSFHSLILSMLSATTKSRLRYTADFVMGLDLKHQAIFLLAAPLSYLCVVERRERGLYLRLLSRVKMKVLPLPRKVEIKKPAKQKAAF